MAAFVTPAEYAEYFSLDDYVSSREETDLEAACDMIRDYLCQEITATAGDVVTLQGTDTRALLLPELPVTAVTSVTLDGDAITDFTFDDYGLLWRDDPEWWGRGNQYVVTYSHGYAVVPAIMKVVAFQLARRAPSNGIRQESIADYSATYAVNVERDLLSSLDSRVYKRIPMP